MTDNDLMVSPADSLQRLVCAIRDEAIKEFAERLKEKFSALEYRANTPRKTVRVDELRSQADWLLHEVTKETINELVKEMVGADNAE